MSHAYERAPTSHRQDGPRDESPSKWTAFVVHTIADIAAAFVGLWIVFHLTGADQSTLFVQYVQDMAYWLAGWSQNIATVENEHLRLVLNYGLPALVYLLLGHGIAARMRPQRVARDQERRIERQTRGQLDNSHDSVQHGADGNPATVTTMKLRGQPRGPRAEESVNPPAWHRS